LVSGESESSARRIRVPAILNSTRLAIRPLVPKPKTQDPADGSA
jgi:hypothetical protein